MEHDRQQAPVVTGTADGQTDGQRDDVATAAPHLERDHERLRAPEDVRELAARRHLGTATPGRTLGRIGLIALVYVVTSLAAVVVDRWVGWAIAWSLQAFLLLVCGAAMHEGIHANITGRRAVDRVVAFVAGWLIFLPAAAYRPYHLQHHATTISADDPSGANAAPFRSRRHYLLVMCLSGPGFTAQMWGIAWSVVLGRSPSYVPSRQRRRIRVETLVAVALYALVAVMAVTTPAGRWILLCWVVPAVLGLCVVAPFVLTSEHYLAAQDRPLLESAATVRSNRVLAFVYLNNNHHTAHHLLSSCNPRRLGEITDLIEGRVVLHHRSYTAFHRSVWRSLDW